MMKQTWGSSRLVSALPPAPGIVNVGVHSATGILHNEFAASRRVTMGAAEGARRRVAASETTPPGGVLG